MAKKQGKGSTVTFVSASGDIGTACIIGISESGMTVAMEDAVCMTSTQMEKIGNELIDLGSSTLNIFHDPTLNIDQLKGETGVLTITSPISVSGNAVPESKTGNAVMTNYSVDRQVGSLMSGTIEFTWTGDGSYVYVPESLA